MNPYRFIEQDQDELGFQVALAFEYERIMGWRWAWGVNVTAAYDRRSA